MIVTAGVKHCFPADDHRGVSSADAWRSFLPKAIANRKIILTDTRQLSNPESDRGSTDRHCIGRHLGIINEQLDSGTGMYLLQSTFEAIEKETKLHPQLVVLDFCNANRHRSVAFMRCGGSCSKCRDMDIPPATRVGQRALERFKPNVIDHDTSDSAYQQRRPLSVSLPPRSVAPGPRSTSSIRGPLQLSQVQSVGPRRLALHPLHPP